ncbi:unnamed protein product [Adineta ricciae]|uniref:Uncharacterized protein n=1 Tax=Adineta ricciae TaxID=249248 RepID=A0A815SAJ0_ADIRI|nr:unnamed protein product [Adineta ricciae]
MIRLQEEIPSCRFITTSSIDVISLHKLTSSATSEPSEKVWVHHLFHTDETIKTIIELENEIMDSAENVDKDILDHVHGSLLGLTIGDVVRASVERQRRTFFLQNPVMDLHGGANSLVACRDFNPYDQLSDRDDFERGILSAVTVGDIITTTAAAVVYGQLAGAHYGRRKSWWRPNK